MDLYIRAITLISKLCGIVAALLMAAGVGVFGVLSGLLASWFIEPTRTSGERDEDLEELRALRAELAEVKAMLAQR